MDGWKGEGWRTVSGSEEGVMGARRRSCVVVVGLVAIRTGEHSSFSSLMGLRALWAMMVRMHQCAWVVVVTVVDRAW